MYQTPSVFALRFGIFREERVDGVMGGREGVDEWLDTVGRRREGSRYDAENRESARNYVKDIVTGKAYNPAVIDDFGNRLRQEMTDADTTNLTEADIRLAMWDAVGGDAETAERLKAEADASHDEVEDILSQNLRFSLFGKKNKLKVLSG